MGLTVSLDEKKEATDMVRKFKLPEGINLYKTEDGKIVRDGDPAAAFIYRRAGQQIPLEEAIELDLVGVGDEASTEPDAEPKGAKLLKDATDEELLDHLVDVIAEVRGRDFDEELLAAKVPEWAARDDEPSGEPSDTAQKAAAEGEGGGADLSGLSRPELNARAAELGIERPERIKGGMPKVIEAIEAAQKAAVAGAEDA